MMSILNTDVGLVQRIHRVVEIAFLPILLGQLAEFQGDVQRRLRLFFSPKGIAAGAIISGAYFGDKMSPLSDTTNLAPAMAGTDLFTHIRHMLWTTTPSVLIALVLYAFAARAILGVVPRDGAVPRECGSS
mgnify:CR=1 FL=1